MGLIEREWMRLRAAEMVTADPGLSLSDAEEEAVAEWDRGMADRDARHPRGAVEAYREILKWARATFDLAGCSDYGDGVDRLLARHELEPLPPERPHDRRGR